MTAKVAFTAVSLALGLIWSSSASADSMRCGVHIVSASGFDGPTMYEVLKKCGEPTYRIGRQWIYESASRRTRTLVFDATGRLVDIRDS